MPFNIAKELLLFGGELSALEAQRIGLVNKVTSDDDFLAELTDWAQRLASGPTRGLAAAKGCSTKLWTPTGPPR